MGTWGQPGSGVHSSADAPRAWEAPLAQRDFCPRRGGQWGDQTFAVNVAGALDVAAWTSWSLEREAVSGRLPRVMNARTRVGAP